MSRSLSNGGVNKTVFSSFWLVEGLSMRVDYLQVEYRWLGGGGLSMGFYGIFSSKIKIERQGK